MLVIVLFVVAFFVVLLFQHLFNIFNLGTNSVQSTLNPYNLKEEILERVSKNIGYTTPICPTCKQSMEKMPVRAGKCKQCGNKYFLAERPYDALNKDVFDEKVRKVIVNESQLNKIQKEQLNIELMQTSNFFEYENELIEESGKKHPSPMEVFKYKIEKEKAYAIRHRDYDDLYRILINYSGILIRQNAYKEALINFLQAMYMDSHGMPSYNKTHKIIGEWGYKVIKHQNPSINPFNFRKHPYYGATQCISKLKLSYNELENLFLTAEFDDLPYKISREVLLPDLQDAYYDLIDTLEQKQIHNAGNSSFSIYV